MINKIYGLLEIPFIYRLVNLIFAPGKQQLMKPLYKKVFSGTPGSVLDVGCGPKLLTPEPAGLLVGEDINESYIREYTGGFLDTDPQWVTNPPPGRRRLGYVTSADKLPFADGSFDEARSNGLFHHLPDEVAFRTIQEMNRCVRPGGRIIILDAVWPVTAWTRPIAWATLRMDRGTHMRRQEEILHLAEKACPGIWSFDRCTGTLTGMEFLCLQHVKI